jgi:hypothetical protein
LALERSHGRRDRLNILADGKGSRANRLGRGGRIAPGMDGGESLAEIRWERLADRLQSLQDSLLKCGFVNFSFNVPGIPRLLGPVNESTHCPVTKQSLHRQNRMGVQHWSERPMQRL